MIFHNEKEAFKIDLHKNLKPSELDSLLPDATCPGEWLKFNCSCYQISGNGSWVEGREDCMRKGGDLVVINDPEEQVMRGFRGTPPIKFIKREIKIMICNTVNRHVVLWFLYSIM